MKKHSDDRSVLSWKLSSMIFRNNKNGSSILLMIQYKEIFESSRIFYESVKDVRN